VASGQEILSFHFDDVWSVAFSPDGKQILAGVYNEVHLCDVANGQEIRSFQVDRAAVSSVAFSPDGKQILAGVDSEVHLWDVASGQEIRSVQGQYGSVYSVAFSPDGKQILSGMKLWDAANGQEIRSFQGHSDRVSSVAFSPDGKQIRSGSDDNTTRLWDAATGKELARFIGFSGSDTQITAATRDIAVEVVEDASSIEGEWLSITPDGYYNASPRGDRYVNVRVGDTVSGIDSYRSVFYNPEVVEARLNGLPDPDSKAVVTLQEATSFFPPTVTVQARDITTTANATSISVSVSDQNQPIKIIKIIVNGRLLGQDELSSVSGTQGLTAERTSLIVTDNLKEVAFNLPVTLDPGENLIEVMAFNGYTDTRQNTSVTWQTNQRLPPPNLWILAIGVNQYDDPGIQSLNYCVADAQGIIASFKAQEGKRYAKVNTLLIADNAPITPTVKNIRENLTWLDQAGPRDVILLFLAGHGITEGKNFYFVPKDGALKTRTSIDTTKAISDTDILSVLDAPGNRLIFIDACHSGGVDANRMTRALMESNGLVFTASQGDERSTEFADLDRGHGIFTYSIMQGLSGRYNTGRQKDIKILPLSVSVANFVSQEVERRTRDTNDPRTQHPKVYSLGFPDLTIALTN
jgi:WD40 repeat protein